jgi:hypothetical protein
VRRLRDFHSVTLILPGHRARGVVVATARDRVWVEPQGNPQRLHAALPASARISFHHGDQIVVLSGTASLHPAGGIEFRGDDRSHVRNLRESARLAISLPVTVEPVVAHAGAETTTPVTTTTIDLGRGGLLVKARSLGPPGAQARIAIDMPDGLAGVVAVGRVVRTTELGTALAFVSLDPAEADRLEKIVLAVRRRIAQTRIAAAEQEGRYLALTSTPSPR